MWKRLVSWYIMKKCYEEEEYTKAFEDDDIRYDIALSLGHRIVKPLPFFSLFLMLVMLVLFLVLQNLNVSNTIMLFLTTTAIVKFLRI